MKYLLRQHVSLPARWFDTFVAWRYLMNRPGNLEAGLAPALCKLGLPHLAPVGKSELRQKILHLRFDPDNPADRREIIDYCSGDCDGVAALYRNTHARVPDPTMAHWVKYLKGIARMELRGIPFDVEQYHRIQEMRPEIKATLIRNVNETWPVFDGETFKSKAFLRWCRENGIAWPSKVSEATGERYPCLDKDVMKDMKGRHPFIATVRQVRKTLSQLKSCPLTIDPDHRRHYFSTSVFRSVTGRNQPRNFVFSGPKWLRFLIVPESLDHVLVYVDFIAQEFGIAATLSGDPAMRAAYESPDCHMEFAVRAGAAPPGATKRTCPDVRKRYKTVNLGVLYGQTAYGMAARLGIHHSEAQTILNEHCAFFPIFWDWSERMVPGSFDQGQIRTPCGWRSRVPFPSNERTWMNWPMQATGGDIMRLTVTYLDRQNIPLLAPVHDGFLMTCRRSQLVALREAVDYACGNAVEHVLPGFPLRWEFTVYDNGRFEGEDGLPLWRTLQGIVEQKT